MFSSRLPSNLTPNTLAAVVAQHKAAGRALIDLTVSNPTSCGIEYPQDVLQPLANPSARLYDPAPFGSVAAREAVARDYARRGTTAAADRIVLTASTSEAYSLLFKLFCDPGDQVLAPVPSYPLFELLSKMEAVEIAPYRLDYHGRWMVDADSVNASSTTNTRAILAVSPNNPTGSMLSSEDLQVLRAACSTRDAALIIDEVFIDYPLDGASSSRAIGGPHVEPPLTVRLGGLSKSAGLPQVKLGWMVLEGNDHAVADALERLEIICDTYLSVSTPVQAAAAELIERGGAIRSAIQRRIRRNHNALTTAVASHPSIELLRADAGWSAVLRVPSTRSEEQLVRELLEADDVLVHPGFFFDFPHEAFVIISLLPAPDVFDEGVRRMLNRVNG